MENKEEDSFEIPSAFLNLSKGGGIGENINFLGEKDAWPKEKNSKRFTLKATTYYDEAAKKQLSKWVFTRDPCETNEVRYLLG